jgi:hypothetical protein
MTWTGETREFHQKGRKHTLAWTIRVAGATETTTHGVLDGAMQETSHTYSGINIGKKNEVSPEDYALDRAQRKVTLRTYKGYTEVGDDPAPVALLPDEQLPLNLCFYKPDNTLSVTLEKKLLMGKGVLLGRKREGMMHVIRTTEDDVEIYSRRMRPTHDREAEGEDYRLWAERFPMIYEEVLVMLREEVIPPNSILLGELVADRGGKDEFAYVQRVTKSGTNKALQLQQKQGWLSLYVWDIAFWDGEPVGTTRPFSERMGTVEEFTKEAQWLLPLQTFTPQQIWDEGLRAVVWAADQDGRELRYSKRRSYFPTAIFMEGDKELTVQLDTIARNLAQHNGWEGWVVVDPKGIFGDKAYNFRGKPDRPGKYTGKLKPVYEDDCIAYWDPDHGEGTWGNGKYQGQVGSVALYQLDPEGELVYLCDCGGGLTKAHKSDLADPKLFPKVVRVGYSERFYLSNNDKTNAMIHPRILDFRTDKAVDECVNDKLETPDD